MKRIQSLPWSSWRRPRHREDSLVCERHSLSNFLTVLLLFGWEILVLLGSRLDRGFAVPGPFGTCVCFVRIVSSSKLGRLSFGRPLVERLFHIWGHRLTRQHHKTGISQLIHFQTEKDLGHAKPSRHPSPRLNLCGKFIYQSKDCRRTTSLGGGIHEVCSDGALRKSQTSKIRCQPPCPPW